MSGGRRGSHLRLPAPPGIVVTAEPYRMPPADRRGRLSAAAGPPRPGAGLGDPVRQPDVEVGHAGEPTPGQKRGLQVATGPLDQALGLRITRTPDPQPGTDHAAQHTEMPDEFGRRTAVAAARTRGSTAFTIEPFTARPYFGGCTVRTALPTVLRDSPSLRAIALIGICSAR